METEKKQDENKKKNEQKEEKDYKEDKEIEFEEDDIIKTIKQKQKSKKNKTMM